MEKRFKIMIAVCIIAVVVGTILFSLIKIKSDIYASSNIENENQNNFSNQVNQIEVESTEIIPSIINSEKDLKHQVLKLDSQENVDIFNNNLTSVDITHNQTLKQIKAKETFNSFMMDTVAQELQASMLQEPNGFDVGGVHLSVKKEVFNSRLQEIFGEKNAKSFNFEKAIENQENRRKYQESL